MKRRLIVAGTLAAALGGGLVAPALAGTDTPQREKICVAQPTLLPDGYCITWNNPGAPTP